MQKIVEIFEKIGSFSWQMQSNVGGWVDRSVQNLPVEAESGVGPSWIQLRNWTQPEREDSNYGTNPTKCNFKLRNKFRQKREKYCIKINDLEIDL